MLILYFNSNIPSNLSWFTYYLIFYFLFPSLSFFILYKYLFDSFATGFCHLIIL